MPPSKWMDEIMHMVGLQLPVVMGLKDSLTSVAYDATRWECPSSVPVKGGHWLQNYAVTGLHFAPHVIVDVRKGKLVVYCPICNRTLRRYSRPKLIRRMEKVHELNRLNGGTDG